MEHFGDLIGLLIIVLVFAGKALAKIVGVQRDTSSRTSPSPSTDTGGGNGFSWEDWGLEVPEEPAPVRNRNQAPKTAEAELSGQPSTPQPPAAVESSAGDSWEKAPRRDAWNSEWAQQIEKERPEPVQAERQKPWGQEQARHDWSEAQAEHADVYQRPSYPQSGFEQAFPKAMSRVRRLKRGTRSPIVLTIGGAKDLRKAVLLREVLMRPRAFDI